jgi:tetratricopeptide (TPR) repeat protein
MSPMKFTLTWSLAFLALPLLAQHDAHYEPPITGRLGSATPMVINEVPSALDAPTGKISAELLRYPLSGKALKMLRKALQLAHTGDHAGAVKQLQMTLAKCPDSGAYTYSLLGVEYIKTDQIPEAVDALQRSVKFLPHDASNHANLGLAFFAEAQYDRAESELRRALELDPNYKMASRLLSVLDTAKNTRAALPK